MNVLADTNILLRLQDAGHDHYPFVERALEKLRKAGHDFVIFPQVAVEFWRVCTGPTTSNGFGFDHTEADRRLQLVEKAFNMLPEHRKAYAEWRKLVLSPGATGRQVFDARIAALMIAHGLTHILTFNVDDFTRYQDKGINSFDPKTF